MRRLCFECDAEADAADLECATCGGPIETLELGATGLEEADGTPDAGREVAHEAYKNSEVAHEASTGS